MQESVSGLKVGDKVFGIEFSGYYASFIGFSKEMRNYIGKVGVIEEVFKGIDGNPDRCRVRFEDGKDFWYPAEFLSVIGDDKEPERKGVWSSSHYDFNYTLTDKDREAGTILLDPYFVAKQWRTGGRDDSGILIHQLKTIARFGDKNEVAREIKAMYEQAKAMGRIYGIDLEGK